MIEKLFSSKREQVPAEGITGTPLSLNDLINLHNGVAGTFLQIWKEGERNEKRWIGDNWDESKRAKIRRQKRQAYSLPILASKLRYISASQRQLRTSYLIEPTSDPNDEIKAELATIQMKAVEARSNAKYTDSEIFDAGLAIKYGVRKVWLDNNSAIPRVKTYTVDYRNFVWDLNAREYEVRNDALFMAELERPTREYLEMVYGKEAVSNIAGGQALSSFSGRQFIDYYITAKDATKSNQYDLISLFKHCQKTYQMRHFVVFPDSAGFHKLNTPLVGKYNTEEEANEVLRELRTPYLLQGLPEEGEVISAERPVIDYYEFVYNKVLYYERTEWEAFPYDVYFSIKFEDKFVSYQDFLNDPQLIIDRMWSQIDYSMGRDIKNVYEGNRSALDPSETPESAQAKASVTGGIIWTQSKEQVFRAIQSQGANPQWINAVESMIRYLEDMTGGRTFQGMTESAGQSGRAIKTLQQAGQVMASAFLDAFNRFKKSSGQNVLWWIKQYESEEDTIRVHGGLILPEMIELLRQEGLYTSSYKNDGSGYVKINKGGISYLQDCEVELTVKEEGMTETMREKRYLQLQEMALTDPYITQSPTFRKLRLEASDIGWSDRQKIIQEAEEMRKREEQMMQQQAQQQNQETQMKYGKDNLDKLEQFANIRKTTREALGVDEVN